MSFRPIGKRNASASQPSEHTTSRIAEIASPDTWWIVRRICPVWASGAANELHKPPKLRHYLARCHVSRVWWNCLAVHTVSSEPVSAGNSLLNRERTGKNCVFERTWPHAALFAHINQRLAHEFPTQVNRELNSGIRERNRNNRHRRLISGKRFVISNSYEAALAS